MKDTNNVGLVMIHGAGLNTWIWDEMLLSINHPCLCIAFPNREKANKANQGYSLDQYLQETKDQIERAPFEQFILVTHSIGGCLGVLLADEYSTQALGLVGIGSAFPRSGGSFASCQPFPQNYLLPLILRFMGTQPPDDMIRTSLCNDLTDVQSEKIVARFTPESRALYTSKINFRTLPKNKMYIKLTRDQAISTSIQQNMIDNLGATHIEELDSGHLPMLSRPVELANIINEFANQCKKG